MLSLDCIAVPSESDTISVPLSELGPSYGLSASRARMYARYYGLRTVLWTKRDHRQMLSTALTRLLESRSFSREGEGLLVYAKTQTHNSFFESDWLQDLAWSHGLRSWEALTVSMNHCASALSVIHLLRSMGERRLIVLLTGEKSFHPVVSRLSIGVLGEVPVATLLNAGGETWRVANTAVTHEPRFYENPDDMSDLNRDALDRRFAEGFYEFLRNTLNSCGLHAEDVDLIVPYNLNLPLLRQIAGRFGWQDKLYIENIATTGHAYCSDVFFNLAHILPLTAARRVLV